jgi:four helix bundle protein
MISQRGFIMLTFQKLDVYRCAIRFLALSARMVDDLPRGHAVLIDQFRRAALSIPLNIAEAAGRTGEADQARVYAIARGSAYECAAILDALDSFALVDPEQRRDAEMLLTRIVEMLTKLCR